MITCRLTTHPNVDAEIVDSRDDGKFDAQRLDGQPWHYDAGATLGGWGLYPCYTMTVRRSQITNIEHDTLPVEIPAYQTA